MGRAVVTAILLDEMRKAGRPIRLPKNALITPAARDWFKEHPFPVEWEETAAPERNLAVVMDPNAPQMRSMRAVLDRAGGLKEVIVPAAAGAVPMVAAVRRLCGKIFRKEVTKGVVFAADPAVPLVVVSKHHGLRAALGSSVPAVEDACRELGINVLVIDAAGQALFQTRQMIERFLTGPTSPPPEMLAAIEAIEWRGGREDW
ncbi:MAG: hypothetical protein AMXMBFR13_12250 [Phycisphaerae bacterium]